MGSVIRAQPVVAGEVQGIILVSPEPISFWGGYDQHTGEIIDRRHPLSGHAAAGRVLALPFARGSSTTTAVLLEAVRIGVAPLAILTTGVDTFFALASIIAKELYDKPFPVLALSVEDFGKLEHWGAARIKLDGTILRIECLKSN